MEKRNFGTTADGTAATLYTIANERGMRADITDFGASLVSVIVKDKNGADVDVILGYDDAAGYWDNLNYFGAAVGRNCNRISNARISIDGTEYRLEVNDNENNLHSGSNGTARRFWNVKEHTGNQITFQIEDAHLQEGYPGNATIQVTYTLTADNALEIAYQAKADQKTVFNFTNHSYFNLNGADSGSALEHTLQIQASAFTPTDAKAIPSGEIRPVEGTPFDFREAKPIGRDITQEDEQLTFGSGYDHNFVLDRTQDGVEKIATAYSEKSGIRMDVATDCIGIQLYTANFIAGQKGKGGKVYANRDAFCLETQYFPNAINEPNFATPLTEAGETYESRTVYTFSVE